MVIKSLEAYGRKMDPKVAEVLKYRKPTTTAYSTFTPTK